MRREGCGERERRTADNEEGREGAGPAVVSRPDGLGAVDLGEEAGHGGMLMRVLRRKGTGAITANVEESLTAIDL